MENHDERDAKAGESAHCRAPGGDRGGQRQSIQQRMKRQAQRGADPRKLLGGFVRQRVRVLVVAVVVRMIVFAAIFWIAFGQIVVMKMKEALDKKHRQKTAEHPFSRLVERMQLLIGVRQKMEQGDAEHQSGDEADGNLQPRVGEMDEQQKPAARQRSQQDQRAVKCQQPRGRHGINCKSFAI